MRLPIAYALNYPERKTSIVKDTGAFAGTLTFQEPDLERFPCLSLGYEAGQLGGTAPCVLSAADEIVVEAFLSGEVKFTEIYTILKAVLDRCQPKPATSVDVLEQEAKGSIRNQKSNRKAVREGDVLASNSGFADPGSVDTLP